MRCATAIVVASWLFSLVTPIAHAQSSANLPPGILSVDVADQALDGSTTPTVSDPAPQISGRVELGAPSISLTLAGDTAVQLTADVDNRGRFRATVPQPLADGLYTLSINDLPVGSFEVRAGAAAASPTEQAAASAQRAPGPLLDIARVVPYPADFGNAIPGIGFLDGRFFTIEEEAARTAASNGDASAAATRDVERRLAESGWLQRYESRLAAPSRDNPENFRVQFSSFVVEYDLGEDAQAAYNTLHSDDQTVEAPTVGDESTVTLFGGKTPDTQADYQAARLVFRVGPMLGVIVYADLLNQQPDLALLDTVAQNVVGRAAVVASRDTVPLGSMALRLDPSSASGTLATRDVYDVRAGTLTTLFGEDDAMRGNRIAVYTGTTDSFAATTSGTFAARAQGRQAGAAEAATAAGPTPTSVILVEGDAPAAQPAATPAVITEAATAEAGAEQVSAQVSMTSSLYAFPGPSEADVWLTSQEQTLGNATRTETQYKQVTQGPSFGDASATFAVSEPLPGAGKTASGYRIYTRVGEIVAVLEFVSSPGVQQNGVARLMRMQVDCIVDEGCTSLAPLPASIFGGEDQPVTAEPRRPRAPAQPTPVPTAAAAPVIVEEPPPIVEQAAPVEEAPAAPLEEPTPEEAPVEEPTPAQTEEGTPPAEHRRRNNNEEGTPPPAEETTPPPAEEPTQAPAEPTTAPVAEQTPAPVEEPTPVPTEAPAPPPAEEPIAIPTPGPDTSGDQGGNGRDRGGRNDRRDRDRDKNKK